MSQRFHRSAMGLLLLCLALAACPERKAVWVSPGPVGHPIFTFGKRNGQPEPVPISLLRVDRCDEVKGDTAVAPSETAWMIVAPDEGTSELQSIQYGDVPASYVETTRPRQLRPGCYVVTVSAVATARFFLDDQLRVAN